MSKRSRQAGRTDTTPTPVVPAPSVTRRVWLGVVVGGGVVALTGAWWWPRAAAPARVVGRTPIRVYASPTCQCCHKWMDHLSSSGFEATKELREDVTPIKRRYGVPEQLWSCHTALVEGLVVEGHVPADLIQRALAEHPAIAGLAAPGMPNGAPGMEGVTKDLYEVIAFARGGRTEVYAAR